MTHTQNYNLTQWSPEDRVLRKDFNTDNAAIDTALADHAAQLASLTRGKGNCSVEVITYTGNGSTTVTIPFPRRPLFFTGFGGSRIRGDSVQNNVRYAYYSSMTRENIDQLAPIRWSGGTLRATVQEEGIGSINNSGSTYNLLVFYLPE